MADERQAAYEEILKAVRSIRYGSVEVIVQDGRIVQIERKEKVRFDTEGRRKPA